MSNLNANVDTWPASEMAMITNSLSRLQDRKAHVYSRNVELSYGHPSLVGTGTYHGVLFLQILEKN